MVVCSHKGTIQEWAICNHTQQCGWLSNCWKEARHTKINTCVISFMDKLRKLAKTIYSIKSQDSSYPWRWEWPEGSRRKILGDAGNILCLDLVASYKAITLHIYMKAKVVQLRPTLCKPMDYTVHGILLARILEWVAFAFSRGSSQPREWIQVSRIAGRFLPAEPPRKPMYTHISCLYTVTQQKV